MGVVFGKDVSVVSADNLMGDVKTKAGPFSNFLGRKERLEDIFHDVFGYSGAIVHTLKDDHISLLVVAGPYDDFSLISACGMDGICYDIKTHLSQVGKIQMQGVKCKGSSKGQGVKQGARGARGQVYV